MMKKNSFEATDLACMRGGRILFNPISFTLESGECLIISGMNGSGKTSLMRLLAGLTSPYSGSLMLKTSGEEVEKWQYHSQIGYLAHQDSIKNDLTILENLRFWADIYGIGMAKIQSSLSLFELNSRANQRTGELSIGLKRRLGLCRLSLLDHLPLWLMDEPMSGLDQNARLNLSKMIASFCEAGGMLITSSHEALPIKDKIEISLEAFNPELGMANV